MAGRQRGFVMSDYLYGQLVQLADENGNTIGEEANRAIENWLDLAGMLPHPDTRRRMTPGRSNTRKAGM